MARIPSPSLSNFTSWANALTDTLNALPNFSFTSGAPTSLAPLGTIAINVGSSSSLLWVNTDGTSSGWTHIHIGA